MRGVLIRIGGVGKIPLQERQEYLFKSRLVQSNKKERWRPPALQWRRKLLPICPTAVYNSSTFQYSLQERKQLALLPKTHQKVSILLTLHNNMLLYKCLAGINDLSQLHQTKWNSPILRIHLLQHRLLW